jgi:hypothetical protein
VEASELHTRIHADGKDHLDPLSTPVPLLLIARSCTFASPRPPGAAGENPGGSHGAAMVCKKTRFTSASGVHRLCFAAETCLDTSLGDIFRPSSCFTRCGQPCWLSASQCDELTSRPALASQTLAETPETTPESGGTPAPARKGAKCFEAEYTYPMDVNVTDVGPLSLFHPPRTCLCPWFPRAQSFAANEMWLYVSTSARASCPGEIFTSETG